MALLKMLRWRRTACGPTTCPVRRTALLLTHLKRVFPGDQVALLCKPWACTEACPWGSPGHVALSVCEHPRYPAMEGQGPRGQFALTPGTAHCWLPRWAPKPWAAAGPYLSPAPFFLVAPRLP